MSTSTTPARSQKPPASNLAIITGERINWDARRMRAVNSPKADKLVRPAYRKGWTL